MTDVWIVLIEDRHADVEARPYSTEDAALAAAREAVDGARDVDCDAQLTTASRRDGWVLYLPYGSEGDCVRVVKRQMDRKG